MLFLPRLGSYQSNVSQSPARKVKFYSHIKKFQGQSCPFKSKYTLLLLKKLQISIRVAGEKG